MTTISTIIVIDIATLVIGNSSSISSTPSYNAIDDSIEAELLVFPKRVTSPFSKPFVRFVLISSSSKDALTRS